MKSKAGIGALMALCAAVTAAPAATRRFSDDVEGTILLTSGNGATWTVANNLGTAPPTPLGACAVGAGLGVDDAVLDPTGENRGDAFDGAFALWVNDQRFVAPDTVDVTDQRLTAGPVELAGLRVTIEYRALQSSPMLRALVTFENPTTAPFGGKFLLGTNLGSDSLTAERGPNPPTRNWHVTSDSATAPTDPVILIVSQGPEPFGVTEVLPLGERFLIENKAFPCPSNTAGRQTSGDLIVPAGQTVRLLQFVRLASTNAEGVAAGAAFDDNPALDSELMAGITPEQRLSIVNWSFFRSAALTGGVASWFISGLNGTSNGLPTGGKCGPIPGIGVFDAGITSQKIDAFDGGLLLFVDDVPLPPTTPVSEDDGVFRVGPATLSGLEVMLTYDARFMSPTLRTLVLVHNPTAGVVSTQVALATNFGSDDGTDIRATSDGNLAITAADRWAITSDAQVPPLADPVSTHVVAGPGTPAVLPAISTDVFQCSGSNQANGLLATYDLSVGPGETQTLLLFNQVHTLVADAISDAPQFDATPLPGDVLVDGLDPRLFTTIVNWRFCRGTTHREAICRVTGLEGDTLAAGTAGAVLDRLSARLGAASAALEDAQTAICAARKGAAKRGLKMADASLKTFVKLLKSKKVRAIIMDAARTRLGATAAEIRTTVRQLGTQAPIC